MKLFFTKFVLLLIFSFSSKAQILNADFEDWFDGKPLDWFVKNNITQTTDAQSGMYAVKGESFEEIIDGKTYIFGPSINNANYDEDIFGVQIRERPKKLHGYFIFKPVDGETGYLSIGVTLLKWIGDGNTVIGSGGALIANTFFLDSTYTPFNININYYSSDIPDTVGISVSLTSQVGGSIFYVDNLSFIFNEIISPSDNEILIAGEKDTIKWDATADNINILYSLDDGNTYITIESNYPADSSKYIWDIPNDLLSAKAKIKIEDSEDNTQFDEKSVYIKPWQLTRNKENGDFELFEPGKNGWSFSNMRDNMWPLSWWEHFNYYDGIDPNTSESYPQREPFKSALSDFFPDWPLFVEALGINNCYIGDTEYRTRATTIWKAIAKSSWRGSCEGFAVSSLLIFYYKEVMNITFPEVGNLDNIFSDSINDDIRKLVNRYFVHQFADPYTSYDYQRRNVEARQTLQELKDMFSKNNKDAMPLGFYNNNGSGGHAVTPYKLERIGESSSFNLRVYDSNNPAATNRGIRIDSAANTWTELTGLTWGSGTTGCILGLRSGEHLFNVRLPSKAELNGAPTKEADIFKTESSKLNLYNNSSAEIIIKNSEGVIGYKDSIITNTIIDAIPMIPKTGSNHPPIGYNLPQGDYTIQIDNFSDSSSYLFILEESTIYNFRRYDAVNSETDMFNFSDGLNVKNIDQTTKNISLETIIEEDSSEKVFVTDKLQISQNDSIHVNELERDKLVLKNYGIEKSYDLQVRSTGPSEAKEFNHVNISLSNNSSHQVVPDWNNLDLGTVKILIDVGNDGTIDDSIFVDDQPTNVKDIYSSNVPNNYRLNQNYPNPFNPTTTISFDLPEQSYVTLSVYNILGQEVATLINEVKRSGSYKEMFDASSLPSGVYIYKLTAGEFSSSRKMIVIK